LLQELAAKEDSEQSPEISSMIEESSDADDGNSSSYEELVSQSYYLVYNDFYIALIYFTNLNQKNLQLKSLDSKFS
jgi:predicted MPP superfamily phosphohydrolase